MVGNGDKIGAENKVSVSPSRERVKERPGNDPVRQAIVSIQGT
jgi:hypothetical protein